MLRSVSLHAMATSALLLASAPTLVIADEEPIHHVSAEVCSNCHQEIYRQWKGSMHAQSTALEDPIHGTFYQMVAGSPTEEGVLHKASGKYPICLQCHAPNAALDQRTKLDAKVAYSEGVNCVACHTLKTYKGIEGEDGKLRLGIQAYELSDKLQAPLGIKDGLAQLAAAGDDLFGGAGLGADSSQKPNPHRGEPIVFDGQIIPALPMEANPRLVKSSDACMGCHDQRDNPHGVPLCQTGNEYRDSLSNVNCLSCHMPVAEGIADHSMGGGHSPAMLKRAVIFDVNAVANGDTLETTVYLKNQLPHAMPTGAPFRNLFIKLTAYDDQGEVIWENAEGHPAQSDPQAYLSYALADDEGMPAPPPTATEPGEDTRLRPHEERELVYEIPAEGVALVRGELFYNLLWPGLVKKFDHLPTELTDPVMIAEFEQMLNVE
ncbi:cytochrome c family protein [Halochromatium salexigens]|uniref:Cytochrome c family protein n=1 Tax=Halochromatium salexigens TaxID=49447 RepID=A0AAJ0XE93_HALSE|nr:cytochrome c family protein [Halochromatium salexigens]MBK5929053.1 cytochrome c family protein [Halochromatium salexigens]